MKKLLAVVLLLAPALPAQAAPVTCAPFGNYNACMVNNGPGGNDLILVEGPLGVERIRVICKDEGEHEWKSYGANQLDFVHSVVTHWCS